MVRTAVSTTISIPINITENPGFQDLTDSRKLSGVISELLYNYLQMNRSDNKDIKKLQNQLEKVGDRKDEILEQIKKLQEEEKEVLTQQKLDQEKAEKFADAIRMNNPLR